MELKKLSAASRLVGAGRPHETGSPLNTPLIPASNFQQGGKYDYARNEGTPTWEALESIVASLEGGKALAFSSGMAAVAAVFDLLKVGREVVLPDDWFLGVAGLASGVKNFCILSFGHVAVAVSEGWIDAVAKAVLVWVESHSNSFL